MAQAISVAFIQIISVLKNLYFCNGHFSMLILIMYNCYNKLRNATVELKYDPAGNRISKNSSVAGNRKYVVDVVGDLPVILLEIDPADMSVKKAYIYANSQIVAQYDSANNKYYYLHDRLGSVRQMINQNGAVVKLYTYNPFGETIEEQGTIDNDFKFTGQYFDKEIGQYYLRARQYSPYLSRFTGRDLIMGNFDDPMSLHKYLYCGNNPINMIDPMGLFSWPDRGKKTHWTPQETWGLIQEEVIPFVRERGFWYGPTEAFGFRGGKYDMKILRPRDTFEISEGINTSASEFGNYMTAYTCTYLYGTYGDWGVRAGGHGYSLKEYGELDDIGSRYYISAGFLKGRADGTYNHAGLMEFINAKQTLQEYIVDILASEEKYDQDRGYLKLSEAQVTQELENFTYFWNSAGNRF